MKQAANVIVSNYIKFHKYWIQVGFGRLRQMRMMFSCRMLSVFLLALLISFKVHALEPLYTWPFGGGVENKEIIYGGQVVSSTAAVVGPEQHPDLKYDAYSFWAHTYYVDIEIGSAVEIPGDFSIVLFILKKLYAAGTIFHYLGYDPADSSGSYDILVSVTAFGNVEVESTLFTGKVTTTIKILVEQWTCLAFERDYSNGNMKIYLNRESEKFDRVFPASSFPLRPGLVRIGWNQDGRNPVLTALFASITCINLYGETWTPDQIGNSLKQCNMTTTITPADTTTSAVETRNANGPEPLYTWPFGEGVDNTEIIHGGQLVSNQVPYFRPGHPKLQYQSYGFQADNYYVDIEIGSGVEITDFSFVLFVWRAGSNAGTIFHYLGYDDSTNSSGSYDILLRVTANDNVVVISSLFIEEITTSITIPSWEWTCLALERHYGDGTMKIYVDGDSQEFLGVFPKSTSPLTTGIVRVGWNQGNRNWLPDPVFARITCINLYRDWWDPAEIENSLKLCNSTPPTVIEWVVTTPPADTTSTVNEIDLHSSIDTGKVGASTKVMATTETVILSTELSPPVPTPDGTTRVMATPFTSYKITISTIFEDQSVIPIPGTYFTEAMDPTKASPGALEVTTGLQDTATRTVSVIDSSTISSDTRSSLLPTAQMPLSNTTSSEVLLILGEGMTCSCQPTFVFHNGTMNKVCQDDEEKTPDCFLDPATLQEVLKEIVKKLLMNPKNTSAAIRKKISAPNKKRSSERIGWVGAFFLCLVVACILSLDCVGICQKYEKRQKKKQKKIRLKKSHLNDENKTTETNTPESSASPGNMNSKESNQKLLKASQHTSKQAMMFETISTVPATTKISKEQLAQPLSNKHKTSSRSRSLDRTRALETNTYTVQVYETRETNQMYESTDSVIDMTKATSVRNSSKSDPSDLYLEEVGTVPKSDSNVPNQQSVPTSQKIILKHRKVVSTLSLATMIIGKRRQTRVEPEC